jgi:hypothetical protein
MDSATNVWNGRSANHHQRAVAGPHLLRVRRRNLHRLRVRNIKTQGALLVVPGEQPLPTNFTLIHVTEGTSFDSHVIWRHGACVRVTIGDRHDLQGPIDA